MFKIELILSCSLVCEWFGGVNPYLVLNGFRVMGFVG